MSSSTYVCSNKNNWWTNQQTEQFITNANQLRSLNTSQRVKSKERRGDSYIHRGYIRTTGLVGAKGLPRTGLVQDELNEFQMSVTSNRIVESKETFNMQQGEQRKEFSSYSLPKASRQRSDTVSYKQVNPKRNKRRRANSLPHFSFNEDDVNLSDGSSKPANTGGICEEWTANEHKMFAIMSNVAHVIFGVAIIQLGIVGTWYKRYMNFQEDQLRHVLYICILFIISGSYGIFMVVKRLADSRSHKIAYKVLTSLAIIASCFILAIGVRIIMTDKYNSSETVVVAFDGLLIGLAAIEVPTALISVYLMTSHHKALEKEISITDLMSVTASSQQEEKAPPTWSSIFNVILNVAHIVLGLCIIELGMVGMVYRRFMNIDSTGLFSVVFVSVSFVSVGVIGVYNQVTGKISISCNRSMYTCASMLAVGSATTILTLVSVTMASNKYYAGIEAIVAFDSMILSMSGIELGVGIAALILVLTPVCLSKLKEQGNKEPKSVDITHTVTTSQ